MSGRHETDVRNGLDGGIRAGLLADIKTPWPDAWVVPVMPNGALPLSNDLIWAGTAYVVKAKRAGDYVQPEPGKL